MLCLALRFIFNSWPDLGPLFENNPRCLDAQVDWRVYDERSLLALQGPIAAQVLQQLVTDIDLSKVYFSDFVETNVKGIPCFITRTGYTGEDGFEISIPTEKVVELATALVEAPRVKMGRRRTVVVGESVGRVRMFLLSCHSKMQLHCVTCCWW